MATPGAEETEKQQQKWKTLAKDFARKSAEKKKAKKSIWRQGRNQIINFNSFLFPSMLRHRNRVIYVVLWLLKGTSKRHKLIESVETWRWNGGCCCCVEYAGKVRAESEKSKSWKKVFEDIENAETMERKRGKSSNGKLWFTMRRIRLSLGAHGRNFPFGQSPSFRILRTSEIIANGVNQNSSRAFYEAFAARSFSSSWEEETAQIEDVYFYDPFLGCSHQTI